MDHDGKLHQIPKPTPSNLIPTRLNLFLSFFHSRLPSPSLLPSLSSPCHMRRRREMTVCQNGRRVWDPGVCARVRALMTRGLAYVLQHSSHLVVTMAGRGCCCCGVHPSCASADCVALLLCPKHAVRPPGAATGGAEQAGAKRR